MTVARFCMRACIYAHRQSLGLRLISNALRVASSLACTQAMTEGVISADDFLKEVRKLARKQFMARALAAKVSTSPFILHSRNLLRIIYYNIGCGSCQSVTRTQHDPWCAYTPAEELLYQAAAIADTCSRFLPCKWHHPVVVNHSYMDTRISLACSCKLL